MAAEYYENWMKDKPKDEIIKEISELRRNIKKKTPVTETW